MVIRRRYGRRRAAHGFGGACPGSGVVAYGQTHGEGNQRFLCKGIGNDHVDFVSRWRSAATGNEENEVYTTEDFASAFLRFENALAMSMEVSWALNGEEDDALKLDINGTKGGVS